MHFFNGQPRPRGYNTAMVHGRATSKGLHASRREMFGVCFGLLTSSRVVAFEATEIDGVRPRVSAPNGAEVGETARVPLPRRWAFGNVRGAMTVVLDVLALLVSLLVGWGLLRNIV